MAGIPQNFQAVSNVLANYDFVDIANGTGYINFYAGTTVDLKSLSNFEFYSDTIYEEVVSAANTDYALLLDHDFDVVLNRPLDIRGLGVVSVGLGGKNYANTVTLSAYFKITLRKWNGSAETDIVTNDSRVVQIGGDAYAWAIPGSTTTTDLNVPLTHFKKGETLRLTIQLYGKNNGAGNSNYLYGHDPMNRTSGWDTTGAIPSKLVFQCPVRLNL